MSEQLGKATSIAIGGLIVYGIVHLVSVGQLGVCLPGSSEVGRIYLGQLGSEACNTPSRQEP